MAEVVTWQGYIMYEAASDAMRKQEYEFCDQILTRLLLKNCVLIGTIIAHDKFNETRVKKNPSSPKRSMGVLRGHGKYAGYAVRASDMHHAGSAYCLRSIARSRMGMYLPAVKDATLAALFNPMDDLAYYSRAYCYLHLEQYALAGENVQTALFMNPRNSLAQAVRAALYLTFQRYDMAIADAEAALMTDKHNSLARDVLQSAQMEKYSCNPRQKRFYKNNPPHREESLFARVDAKTVRVAAFARHKFTSAQRRPAPGLEVGDVLGEMGRVQRVSTNAFKRTYPLDTRPHQPIPPPADGAALNLFPIKNARHNLHKDGLQTHQHFRVPRHMRKGDGLVLGNNTARLPNVKKRAFKLKHFATITSARELNRPKIRKTKLKSALKKKEVSFPPSPVEEEGIEVNNNEKEVTQTALVADEVITTDKVFDKSINDGIVKAEIRISGILQ